MSEIKLQTLSLQEVIGAYFGGFRPYLKKKRRPPKTHLYGVSLLCGKTVLLEGDLDLKEKAGPLYWVSKIYNAELQICEVGSGHVFWQSVTPNVLRHKTHGNIDLSR